MTKEEFIRKWRCAIVGGFLYGTASDLRDSPLAKAGKALLIPEEVEKHLSDMWDDIVKESATPLPEILPKSAPVIDQALRQSTLAVLRTAKSTIDLESAWKASTLAQRQACQDDLPALKAEAAKYDSKPNGTVKK